MMLRSRTMKAAAYAFDQALSSGGNFLVLFLAARLLSVTDLGRLALELSVVFLATGLVRACVGEPLVALFAQADDPQTLGAAAIRSATAIGAGGGALVLSGALIWPGSDIAAAALVMFLAATQDACRYLAFAETKPWKACASDALWVGVQLLLLGVVI